MDNIKSFFKNISEKYNNLSKRERILISILPIFLFGFLWYTFVFSTYMDEVTVKIEEKEKFIEIVDTKIELVGTLNNKKENFEINKNDFFYYIEKYFLDFKEEYLLKEIFDLANEFETTIKTIDIPKGVTTELNTGTIYTMNLEVEGLPSNIDMFIKNIEKLEKELILTSYNITELDYEETLYGGQLQFTFGSLNVSSNLKEIFVEDIKEENQENFLEEFASLAKNPRMRYPELKELYEDSIKEETDEKTLSQLYAEDRDVYSLGQLSSTKPFAINGDGVNASLTRSKDHIINQTSYLFNYTIDTTQENLEAMIGFNNAFIIEKQHDYISVWLKSKNITGHEIHLEIMDSTGEKFDILLTSGVDWKDWQVKEIDLPIEINYPAKITRLYVSPSEYKQVKNGEIIINGMQVADEKEDE